MRRRKERCESGIEGRWINEGIGRKIGRKRERRKTGTEERKMNK